MARVYLEGLNLTCANYVIICDPWWNPSVEDQAVDRAHRIGQEKNVSVIKLTIKGTVEERILSMQEKKREIAQKALQEDGSKSKSSRLTVGELAALFNVVVRSGEAIGS